MKTNDVIGLGNALMDLLIEVDDNKFSTLNLAKGEMHLVDEKTAKATLSKLQDLKIEQVPGGSSANTLKCVSFLGGKAILCGKVGNDQQGNSYIQQMEKLGVATRINRDNLITGHALTFITPDSERTFSVHLGAALTLKKEDILEEDIINSKVLHIEGYQIEGPTKETVMHAVSLAKNNNTLVSIDLADPGLIRRNKDFLKEFVKEHADIVFVNENEAKEFTGLENEEAARELGKDVKIAVVKLGKEGSIIYSEDQFTFVECYLTKAVDTTGAGDSYAAGFLYGYCNGWSLEKAGKLGSLLASKIVERIGVKTNDLNVEELKSMLS